MPACLMWSALFGPILLLLTLPVRSGQTPQGKAVWKE